MNTGAELGADAVAAMPEVVVVAVEPLDDEDDLGAELLAAFRTIRDALARQASVVVAVRGADLLGQGSLMDAACANALLGMVRTAAVEGQRHGWRINVMSDPPGGAATQEAARWISDGPELSGRLVQLGPGGFGRVSP